MKHFLTTADWSHADLAALLDHATQLKANPLQPLLKGKSIALVFFNPSLRTRTSFELGAWQMGGHAIVLEPGKGAWEMAFGDGEVMDGNAEEHVQEAARVLSQYCDLIGIRCFPKFVDWQVDRKDHVLKQFAKYSTVPVINLETITHPCQELAHILTLKERLGNLTNRKYVLTWTYHPKPLNTAVANSAALISTKFGMDVTLLCPNEEYLLDERYLGLAKKNAEAAGGSFQVTHNIEEAYDGAEVIYAKSWGALPYFGNWEPEKSIRAQYRHFIVDEKKMALTKGAGGIGEGLFSHCLPARRNVKATDAVMDSPNSLIIEEAANRLHVQKALMAKLVGGS